MTGWDRRLWGVEKDTLGPLGTGWGGTAAGVHYDGEPSRPLLFTSRAHARAWCAQRHATYAAYPDGHVCRAWRFRAVRVRERITVVTE